MSTHALKLIEENRKNKSRVLDLGGSEFTKLPEELKECIWLEELNFSSSKNLRDVSLLSELKNLKKLILYNTQVHNLLPLSKLSNLKRLDCDYTPVSDLLPICELRSLKILSVSRTQISDLSPISGLTNLQKLNISQTQISDLSPVSGLINLQELKFSETQISDLSPVSQLDKLAVLDCFISKVSDLSPLKELVNLNILYCGNTQIEDLSPILKFIRRGINIEMLGWVNNGRRFDFLNCPLIHPPPEIARKGNEAILKYFAEREKQQFKNNEIKLTIVGNSTTGKTSLSRFIRERNYQSIQSTTHGIISQQWQPKNSEMQVNLWDFGGQEYYHATHRLFLGRNSVYVLLWDKQTDKGGYCGTPIHLDNDSRPTVLQLEHFPQKWWLQNIRYYTNESNPTVPILLVQNKCARDGIERVSNEFEKPPFNLLPEWLDNHIDLEAAADSTHPQHKKWLRQFETFEERLLDKLQSQLAHYEFAVYHREIRDEIRRLASEGINDMPFSDFETLCRRFDPEAKMDLVQIYLRDITGDILYYPNNERLYKRVFLRPAWVCDSIYQILSRQVQGQHGLFGLNWVCKALGCDEANALDFIALMREFDLIFEYPKESADEVEQWVAAQYLPETCIEQEELTATKKRMKLVHGFTIWFPDFLPKSHIARFVANWGSHAKDKLFWKNGLLFETKDCTVLVERVADDKIQVEVQPHHSKQKEAVCDVFNSFLKLEDGQSGFAVSLDENNFVLWQDVRESIHSQAKQVKTLPYTDPLSFTALDPFFVFQQPITPLAKKVFISYSKSDKPYLEQLKKHLAPLRRQGLLETWDDLELIAGEPWDAAIHQQLNAADIIILMVSADFMATDYIWEIEIKKAIERHEQGDSVVIPIIIHPCLWQEASFAHLTAIPEKGKAISMWGNYDEAWAQVAEKIKQVAEK